MKTTKVILSIALLIVCTIVFTSNTTVEKSNTERISQLSSELIELQKEIKELKSDLDESNLVGVDPIIGEIIQFGGNFEPKGWRYCNGQILKIRDNSALFAILGITYGGDGKTTFALPNLNKKDKNGVIKFPRHIIATTGVFPRRR